MNNKTLIPIIVLVVVATIDARVFTEGNKTRDFIKLTQKEILSGADKRIEKYRKGFADLTIVRANGAPVSNADIKIEQTNHEFLFGANHSLGMWDEILDKKFDIEEHILGKPIVLNEELLDDYLKKFNAFANYTLLPAQWNIYEPEYGKFTNEILEEIIHWMRKNGYKIRALNHVWNTHTPHWVSEDCDKLSAELEERVINFISHFGDKVDYLTVVNELANPFRKIFLDDKMTKCIKEAGIVKWGKKWFTLAREENAKAKLVINEVSVIPEKGFPNLLDALRDSKGKLLFDGIGIQSHMYTELWRLEGLWKGLELYSTFGVPLHFTEVTVLSGTPLTSTNWNKEDYGKTTTAQGEKKQAENVVNFYTLLFSHPAVASVNWWNLTDLKAWRDAPAGLLRKDMSPKPAYTALMGLIYNKWWTKTQTTTSKQGRAQFKGFYGDYKIIIITDSGKSQTFNIKLSEYGKRNFRLVLK